MTQPHIIKTFFDKNLNYPDDSFVIRIRKEVIAEFLNGKKFKNVLDIACGNGEISIQFLNGHNRLTLFDLSENMLQRAMNRVPKHYINNVTAICGNFEELDLPDQKYDLVICTGLLAHVKDTSFVLEKMSRLVENGGYLILQNTNAVHFYSAIIRFYRSMVRNFSYRNYTMNALSAKDLQEALNRYGFQLINSYHSITSFLFLGHFISNKKKFAFVKKVFGSVYKNLRRPLGNDLIYCFKKN